jgi:hypothetical protein
MHATLTFSNPTWLLPAAALCLLALIILILTYRNSPLPPKLRRYSIALKLAGFLLLALCLLQPEWIAERADPGANMVAVLVDNSRSLHISDNHKNLDTALTKAEIDKSSWLADLAEDFTIRRYAFDSKLQRRDTFTELNFNGTQSSIHHSLESIAQRYKGRPLAGIILITDGNATDTLTNDQSLTGLAPIYPVIASDKTPAKDLAITNVLLSQTVFEDAPVTISADIAALGYANQKTTLRLSDLEGKELQSQTFTPRDDSATHSFRFLHRPLQPGVSFYKLTLSSENAQPDEEATLANNERFATINRGRGPYRVLYVSGRPNWEYKFLRRALAEDEEIEMPALIRVAKREPKFEWRGREGESSNPLFRGFQNADGEELRYDEPVLVRLNIADEKELREGFPRDEETCFKYHAIIVDDLEAAFFTVDQMDLIEQFVSRRGGGFLMLGGQESFHHGKYLDTPIASLLPIHMEKPAPDAPAGFLKFDLTREGWLEPWARLRENRSDEELRIAAMSDLQTVNLTHGLKPGASLIANLLDTTSGARWPGLAVQRFGDGRSAAFMSGDVWRWGFKDEKQRPDMEKAWRQIVRWLVSDVPNRVTLKFQNDTESEGTNTAKIEVRVLDEKFQPLNDANVSVKITDPEKNIITLAPRLSETQPGVFTATFSASAAQGWFLAEATVTEADDTLIATTEEGWTPNADEFKSLTPNKALLEDLATKTGGQVYALDELSDLVKKLPETEVPVTRTVTTSLWHTPWVFLLALACFIGEWALRRQRGLA